MLRSRVHARLQATLRRRAVAPTVAARRTFIDMSSGEEGFGEHCFKGVVAQPYLEKHGLTAATLDDPSWTKRDHDKVALAVMDWARDNSASNITHWWQPMGASGVRPGQTGQVTNRLFTFADDGSVKWELKGKDLIQGETDGSSFPNGGLRDTHTAGGYLAIDTTSPIFIKGDLVHVPTVFVSYNGHALDEKIMLLRAGQALTDQGCRLLKLLGLPDVKSVSASIGLEQEFFLVPRDQYYRRPDLQLTGRTVIGATAPREQEMCDHYMAPINPKALDCMNEMQYEAYKLGIPLRTRHREVAPGQYEFAPMFGSVTTQIDQNLLVMQIIEEVAARHGFAALLQEKPFSGINGSGKHNNWSLWTDTGVNLLCPDSMNSASGNPAAFPTVMAGIVRAINVHGDMGRCAIACPGNDFRLGACEAPPAIVSTYLGDDMSTYLEGFMNGNTEQEYAPGSKTIDLGVDAVLPFEVPAEDRNRTSPLPYGGKRFEFRAVGSSQNVSLVNTVLATTTAESFKVMADEIEGGASAGAVAGKVLKDNWKCVFNGNNYSEEWPIEAGERGVWRIDSGVESIARLADPKNTALFAEMGVMSVEECVARTDVNLDHYTGTVEMEAKCLVSMIEQHIVPSCDKAGVATDALAAHAEVLKAKLAQMHAATAESPLAAATVAHELRHGEIEEARVVCDDVERKVPADLWTLATYKELLFLDQNQGDEPSMIE